MMPAVYVAPSGLRSPYCALSRALPRATWGWVLALYALFGFSKWVSACMRAMPGCWLKGTRAGCLYAAATWDQTRQLNWATWRRAAHQKRPVKGRGSLVPASVSDNPPYLYIARGHIYIYWAVGPSGFCTGGAGVRGMVVGRVGKRYQLPSGHTTTHATDARHTVALGELFANDTNHATINQPPTHSFIHSCIHPLTNNKTETSGVTRSGQWWPSWTGNALKGSRRTWCAPWRSSRRSRRPSCSRPSPCCSLGHHASSS